MKKIMILGDTGFVGRALVKEFKDDYEVVGLSRSNKSFNYIHESFNLETDEILPILIKHKPNYFISCTRGDFEKQLICHKSIIDYCKKEQIIFYFYSTANVFDEDMTGVKYENSAVGAKSDYGKYKIECETLIGEYNHGNIIRLPMVMGVDSPRMDQIRNANKEKIKVYDPLYLSLILDDQIAKLHRQVIEKKLKGIFHFASKNCIRQKEFYEELVEDKSCLEVENVEDMYLAIIPSRDDFIVEIDVRDIVKVLKESL